MLITSANDAAIAIAEHIGGSVEGFCNMMNEEALAIGATNSHFMNPHGLTENEHYVTAYDMYLMMNSAMQYELFNQIIHMNEYSTVYYSADGDEKEMEFKSTNLFFRDEFSTPDKITMIGGKTGTSEKIDVFDENGQRVQDKIVSFVGIAPMEDPEYIVLAALDTPSRETGIYISGGVMAAPTVGAVMADILPYLGVQKQYGAEDAAGQEIPVENCSGLTAADAERKLKEKGLQAEFSGTGETVTGQLPAPGQTVPGGSKVLLYLEEAPPPAEVAIPDFTGMHRQQAADTAGSLGLYVLVTGNDRISPQVTVIGQSIPKDTLVPQGTTITLEFTDRLARD